jgi:ribonuclease D
MLRYARDDTHYLLYIYHTMKAALVERAGGSTQLVEEVLRASEVVALYQYTKPVFDVDGYKALLVQYPRNLTPQDEVITVRLCCCCYQASDFSTCT